MATVVKNLSANASDAGDMGSIHGPGRSPGVGKGNPGQYSGLGSLVNRGLAGYSLWGCKEEDATE